MRPADLLDRSMRVARAGELTLLLAAPGEAGLHSLDARLVGSPPLRDALDRGAATCRLTRPEAAALGLPARTAMAGLAIVDAGALGRWGVVAVASAARERDREKRAQVRLVLGVLLACGLVIARSGVRRAPQQANRQRELARQLDVARVQTGARRGPRPRPATAATMGTFAMGIAHEVSTPLGVIFGRGDQLHRRPYRTTHTPRATRR